MISKFLAGLVANISEELLMDLFATVMRELTLKRKKADITKTVSSLKVVIAELENAEGMSEDEKNSRLADAGRAVVERMRNN